MAHTPLTPEAASAAAIQPRAWAVTRRQHLIFSLATVLYWMTLYIYVPILTPFLQDRGLSMGWIGLIVGSYGLTQLAIRFPLGIYSDRMRRRKPFLIAGILAGLVSCALFTLGGSWGAPLAGRLVAGICASAWVPFTVLYASYFRPDQSTHAMGNLSFLTVIGQLAGMCASGWLAEAGGWNTAFLAGIAIAAAGTAAALWIHESPAPAANAASAVRLSWSTVGRSRLLLLVSLLSLLAHCILFITMFGFTPLRAVELGASESQLTLLVIAFMVPHAALSLSTGRWLAPRFGSRAVIAAGFLLSAACTAAIPYSPSLPWLLVTQAFNGAAQALYLPLLLGLAIRDTPSAERATAMGFYQSVYSIGMFAGPYLAGWLNDAGGLKAGFLFGAAIGVVSAALAWLRAPREG
ncbi:MFS transporter [Cohnella lubricantis]|uniref:MFS transporter n=1 Tax=Cohnella lubricantis TaxID=2163172 RepID=A0A841T9L4_9BACL|nr:MFS transporter [Cohnella lubricantis]MBB6677994.1 MFS transporter [Cohnella lubricantis]MBP2120544.1 MFS family permease [Cohnella lubricantis]